MIGDGRLVRPLQKLDAPRLLVDGRAGGVVLRVVHAIPDVAKAGCGLNADQLPLRRVLQVVELGRVQQCVGHTPHGMARRSARRVPVRERDDRRAKAFSQIRVACTAAQAAGRDGTALIIALPTRSAGRLGSGLGVATATHRRCRFGDLHGVNVPTARGLHASSPKPQRFRRSAASRSSSLSA